MIDRLVLTALAASLLAGCAATPAEMQRTADRSTRAEERLAKKLAGYEPGQPQSCVQQSFLRNSSNYNGTIVYEQSRGTYYRNDTVPGCRLSDNDILVTRSFSGQLCRGDIVRTIDRASRMLTGSCALGDFTPYRRIRDRQGG